MSEGDNESPRKPQEPKDAKEPRYWTGAHTKHRLRFHLVFVPKSRKRVLRGPIAVRLTELIGQACEVNGWGLRELAVQEDHVHLLVQLEPAGSVSGVVKRLKGGTGRVLRAEFPELEEFLWGANFWARGFFSSSLRRDGGQGRGGDGAGLHPRAAAIAGSLT